MRHLVEDKLRLSKQIQEYLDKSPEVRPFPKAVTRLLSACQDPNVNARAFESIIECDNALSIRLLRLANSPLFCTTGEVKSIARAVSLLGIVKLKSLAMSVAGASMFSMGDVEKLKQRQRLWCHSVGCAVVARKLAEYVPNLNAEDAFLAGMFHDVGKLLFYDVVFDEYSFIESSFDGVSLVDEENFVFGTTHERIGLASAHSWELPTEIKAGIGWHHHPERALECPEVAAAIGLADSIARSWGVGSDALSNPGLPLEVSDKHGLTEEQFHKMEIEAHQAFEEIMQACTS